MSKRYISAESVCAGHPDKLCDFISDSVLDECLRLDKYSRVACEVMAARDKIIVAGEITCNEKVNIEKVVKKALDEIGYDSNSFEIFVYIHEQSKDIAGGVDNSLEKRDGDEKIEDSVGAGDQGSVYGYATDESKSMLPLPLVLSHKICQKLDESRKDGTIKGILPDGKAQVTIEYKNGKPSRVAAIVTSIQHMEEIDEETLKEEVTNKVLLPIFKEIKIDSDTKILVNPSGRFVIGGPEGDAGLTGRKIIVDTYGGISSHGGGAFSGKDATKVDRSAAYMARHLAKHVVASGYAKKCEIGISYAIGKADPVSFSVDTFGTLTDPTVDEKVLRKSLLEVFNLTPYSIIEKLKLREPIFNKTSAYGHFKDESFTWEQLTSLSEFEKAIEKNKK